MRDLVADEEAVECDDERRDRRDEDELLEVREGEVSFSTHTRAVGQGPGNSLATSRLRDGSRERQELLGQRASRLMQ